jgi:steroid delta-isomerase-like uncharacterized protein
MRRRIGPIVPIVAVLIAGLAAGGLVGPGIVGRSAAQEASPAATPCAATTAEENEGLVRRLFEEGWGQGDMAVLEEVLAADYVHHFPHLAGLASDVNVPVPHRADLAAAIQEWRTAFPDLQITIEDLIADGDTVAMRAILTGTQAAPLPAWGAPNTGRRMEREQQGFFRIACGRIAEDWVLPDNLTLVRQLGIITGEELRDAGTPTVATQVP